MNEWIAILDFGSQYTQLIARRVREEHVFCEIYPCNITAQAIREVRENPPTGIILSGGPSSVYREEAPKLDPEILEMGVPILGICYGLQSICNALGAKVAPSDKREYGHARIRLKQESPLFQSVPQESSVWMSHGDRVESLPDGFTALAESDSSPFAAVGEAERRWYGVQFHPEVTHTELGKQILHNFLYEICGCEGGWKMTSFIQNSVREIKEKVGEKNVILGISGGVDSTVAAALLSRALGKRLHCVFVDTGLLRGGERKEVEDLLNRNFRLNLHVVDASTQFLRALRGVTDPEKKRKIIGKVFIEVFKGKALTLEDVDFLAQGTLYPDVIESQSPFGGPSAVIKSHHNVGGLPEQLGFELIEPFRFLFKDEVREIGRELNLPDNVIWRHPFPGPGLAVRIMGEVTEERVRMTQEADKIAIEEIRRAGLYRKLWQVFAVLLPVQSVGVMGDERTYENAAAIRAVTSTDGMTADWFPLPAEVLSAISNRIINEVRGINRVVYDISSKPPATIEWE